MDRKELLQKVIASNFGVSLENNFNDFVLRQNERLEVANGFEEDVQWTTTNSVGGIDRASSFSNALPNENSKSIQTYFYPSYGVNAESSFTSQSFKPKPLSLLMNFGLDGISQWSGSSLDEKNDLQKDCPEGSIYDPFGCMCRPTVCVPVEGLTGDPADVTFPDNCVSITSNYKRTVRISPNATEANITIFLGLTKPSVDFDRLRTVPAEFREHVGIALRKELLNLLTEPMRIDESQIVNVTVSAFLAGGNCSKYALTDNLLDISHRLNSRVTFCESLSDFVEPLVQVPAYFTLSRPPQFRNISESIIEMFVHLAEAIQNKTFVFDVDGFAVEAQGIQECNAASKVNPVFMDTSWCSRGAVQTYYNEEFNITDLGNNTKVFVRNTRKEYAAGEFRLQVLIRSDNSDRIHVSQVAHTCDRPLNCSAFEAKGAVVQKNQTVLFNNRTYDITEYYRLPHDPSKILICGQQLTVRLNEKNVVLGFDMRPELSIISTTLTVISVVALLLTLVIYTLFKELRTLPGLNLMNAMGAMVVGQSALLLNSVAVNQFCHAIGIITHYAFLLGFFFANVIAWDFYRTFGRPQSLQNPNATSQQSIRKRLLCNMAYCYCASACIVAAAVILDYHDIDQWRVGYADLCWIAGARASLVFYALPIAIIVVVNGVLIITTFCKMQTHERSLNAMHVISGRRALSREQKIKREILAYVRIGSVLGFMWFFGIVAGLVRNLDPDPENDGYLVAYEVFVYVFLFTQSSQGLFIFIAFGINKRNRKRIRNLWNTWKIKGCKMCQRKLCICRMSPHITKSGSNKSLQTSSSGNGLDNSAMQI
ncbi:uncharacterized protein LOC129602715 isoform X2 [Paramacrobiotus metropolitanus]|nr:uncharacterized protein LOC129602715 isoform X2 [Paramacrobiotus metropolitanus]